MGPGNAMQKWQIRDMAMVSRYEQWSHSHLEEWLTPTSRGYRPWQLCPQGKLTSLRFNLSWQLRAHNLASCELDSGSTVDNNTINTKGRFFFATPSNPLPTYSKSCTPGTKITGCGLCAKLKCSLPFVSIETHAEHQWAAEEATHDDVWHIFPKRDLDGDNK